ncbi:MAG: metallophosphoesterase family protein [Candidatus Eiseniibacteriota bacterium]
MSEWFFTSDLHGQHALYDQLLALAVAARPRAVILGGDLSPHGSGADGVRRQRLFLQGFLVEFARRLHENSHDTELLLMMGNDDWGANADVLEQHDPALWRSFHGRVVEIDGVRVAGLSWVPITPFGLKDWERWEDGEEESPLRLDGWVSRGAEVEVWTFDAARRSPTIAAALTDLAALSAPAETLYVLHSPPRGTACDLIAPGQHVGSRAIRAYLERHQPALSLSGHIHESPRVSSSYRDTVGRTVVVNPGQFGTSRLCGVWFDPQAPAASLRHNVYG